LLSAAVSYDGHLGHLVARLRLRHASAPRSVTLSSPGADADSPSAAIARHGHAAVAFTEWRDRKVSLRVATLSGRRWRIVTLETRTEQIATPQIAISRNGRVTVAWIAEDKPMALVRAATLPPRGKWQRPVTLTRSVSVVGLGLIPERGGGAVSAWRDVAGTESRVRTTTFHAGRWTRVTTVAKTLERLVDVTLDGGRVMILRWRFSYADKRLVVYESRRKGLGWLKPTVPAQVIRRWDPPIPIDPWNRHH
jgi:hypothetical protein